MSVLITAYAQIMAKCTIDNCFCYLLQLRYIVVLLLVISFSLTLIFKYLPNADQTSIV